MKRRLLILLAVTLFSWAGRSYGQYEPNCYYPQFGRPGQIDTVYGGFVRQELGSDVFNPGPFDNYPNGKIFIEGLPGNVPFLSAIDPKPPFDLHHILIEKKNAFRRYGLRGDFAHLHDSRHWDFYCIDHNDNYAIYWADSDGNYDSTKVTYFKVPPKGDLVVDLQGFNSNLPPCVAHFSSDTVCDVILGILYFSTSFDSSFRYVALYKGGNTLYHPGDTVLCDSLEIVPFPPDSSIEGNYFNRTIATAGNFRNKGVDDIIAYNHKVKGNTENDDWFFFKNDPPFSMKNFIRSLHEDTLLTTWQNPRITEGGCVFLKLFAKNSGDSSDDLLCDFITTDHPANDIYYLYRGGADFGRRRIFVDTPDYVFHSAHYYGNFFGVSFDVAPEFVGYIAGQPLLHWTAGLSELDYEFYYVGGTALNDKVDMTYRAEPHGWDFGRSYIDARGDGKKEILVGMGGYSNPQDYEANILGKGALGLIQGLDLIPINVNNVETPEFRESDLAVYPNPASAYFTFTAPRAQELSIQLFDLLGRMMYQTKRTAVSGDSKETVQLPFLLSGDYIVKISDGKQFYHSQLHIIH